MAKQKNEPVSGGKINVSVDIKHERFGFIQSTDTIYFQHEAEKKPRHPFVVPAATAIHEVISENV